MLIQDGANIIKNGINLDCLKMTLLLIMLKDIYLFILLNDLMLISCTSQSMFRTVTRSWELSTLHEESYIYIYMERTL